MRPRLEHGRQASRLYRFVFPRVLIKILPNLKIKLGGKRWIMVCRKKLSLL